MEIIKIHKKSNENYIHNYVLEYKNKKNETKEYEIVSRNHNLTIDELGKNVCAVSIVGFSDDKILIQKEFRLALNKWIYNFPCGLIDNGETIEIAAKRELLEETSMEIESFIDVLPPSFTSIGVSDEKSSLIFANVKGTPKSNELFVDEEIEPMLVTKKEMQTLLKTEEFAGKTQVISYLWAYDFFTDKNQ